MQKVNQQKDRFKKFASGLFNKNNSSSSANVEMAGEEVKMGEECDGFERLEEIVSGVVADTNNYVSTDQMSVEGLLVLMNTVFEKIEIQVRAKMHTLFLRDDRTPGGPDEQINVEDVTELAYSIALGHFTRTYKVQLTQIETSLTFVMDGVREQINQSKD